jgi:ribosome-binding factor A
MPTRRQVQIADEIQQIVSYLLQREIKDPRVGFVTVTQVDVTQDIKYARIYVSVMGSPEEQKATMDALSSARGFVRRELASRMEIRQVPEVQFKLDRGLEYSDRINRLLNEIKSEEANRTAGDAQPSATSDSGPGEAEPQAEEGAS